MDRLTSLYDAGKPWSEIEKEKPYSEVYRKLQEYEDAKDSGKIIFLPCKRGSTLYVLTCDSPTGIEKTKCENIYINKKNELVIIAPSICDDWGNAKWNFKVSDFGEKVFLELRKAEERLQNKGVTL